MNLHKNRKILFNNNLHKKLLFGIFIFFLLLPFGYRIRALEFSLPDGSIFGHTRSYFADEDAVIADTAKLILAIKESPFDIFNLQQTTYPIFGGILSLFPIGISYLMHYHNIDIPDISIESPQARVPFYTLIAYNSRLISLIFSFFSVILFLFLCRELRIDRILSFFLAMIYAWMPVDILLSLEAKSNALLNTLLLLILLLCIRWVRTRHDRLLYLSALLVGMALGTRLNGILGSAIIFFTIFFACHGKVVRFFLEQKKRCVLFFLPVIGLLVSSPHLLAHPPYIYKMWSNAGSGSLIFSLNIAWENIWKTLKMTAGGWIGIVLFLVVILYAVYVLWKKSPQEKIIASWFIFYLCIFIQTSVPIIRYAYPILPLLLLLFGLLVAFFIKHQNRWTNGIMLVIMAVWGGSVVLFGFTYISFLSSTPLQHIVNAYIEKNIPLGATIGTYFNKDFYIRVPINYEKYHIFPCRDLEEGKRSVIEFDTQPDYLVVPWRGIRCMSEVFSIKKNYVKEKEFSREVSLGSFHFDVVGAGAYREPPIVIYKKHTVF